jgi:hypothetical protein
LPLPGIVSRLLGSPTGSPVATGFKALTLHHQILMSSRATLPCYVVSYLWPNEAMYTQPLLVMCLLAVAKILDLNRKVHFRHYVLTHVTERIATAAVMRHTRTRKMLSSNLCRNTGYHDLRVLVVIPRFLRANCRITHRLGRDCFRPNPFHFDSSVTLPLHADSIILTEIHFTYVRP